MIRVRTRGLVAIVAVVLSLSSCGSDGGEESDGGDSSAPPEIGDGTLTIAESVAPVSFDPQATSLNATWLAWQLSYECLLTSDSTGAVSPKLATGYEVSPDAMTYTFELRSDVIFHNGSPLTPDDVVFTFERLKATGLAYYQNRFASVTSIEADGQSVVFTLSRIDPGFLLNISDPSTAGCAILSRAAGTASDPALEMIGTGPFAVESYAPNSELALTRFDDYWGDTPQYKTLVVRYIPDASAQVAALGSGQIDLAFPTGTIVETLERNPNVEIQSVTSAASITINLNSASEPLQDERVRQAVELAMDREEIAETVLAGGGAPAGLIPTGYSWAPALSDLPNYTRDIEKAKELLDDAGYGDGLTLEFQYIAGYNDYSERLANVLQSQLSEVGIDLTLSPLAQPVWLDNLTNARFDLSYNAYPYFADPLYYVLIRPGRSGPTPPELQALIDEAMNAETPEEYQEAIVTVAQKEAELGFGTFALANTTLWVAHSTDVESVTPVMENTRQFLFDIIVT